MYAPAAATTATVIITTNVGKRFNCWGDLKGLILSTDKPNLYTYNDNMQAVVEDVRSKLPTLHVSHCVMLVVDL